MDVRFEFNLSFFKILLISNHPQYSNRYMKSKGVVEDVEKVYFGKPTLCTHDCKGI